MKKLALGLALSACLLATACEPSDGTATGKQTTSNSIPKGTGFDFYVLSLSWSPGYCRSLGARANRQQCVRDDPFGFVVHGLWPQFIDGYPEFCTSNETTRVDRALTDSMLDIMPSRGLVDHQWKKHGTCTGLSQTDYFSVTRAAFSSIKIPDAYMNRRRIASLDPDMVEADFRAANPAIPANAIAVTCDRRFLRDVRICMSQGLDEFVSCPQIDMRDCPLNQIVVPPN